MQTNVSRWTKEIMSEEQWIEKVEKAETRSWDNSIIFNFQIHFKHQYTVTKTINYSEHND